MFTAKWREGLPFLIGEEQKGVGDLDFVVYPKAIANIISWDI